MSSLTIKFFMSRDKSCSHVVAAVFNHNLKFMFALLAEFVLHLRRAAGVTLRTDTQVLT